MTDHILVVGYGDTGRRAVNSALAAQPDARVTVLDLDFLATAEAVANGALAVHGDGRDRCALDAAAVDVADRIVLAVPDDLDAYVITRSARLLNPDAVIEVCLREPANRMLFLLSDATSVHIGPFDERT